MSPRSRSSFPGGRPRRPIQARHRRSLLVLTEGQVTEVVYLQEWARRHRDALVRILDHHADPFTLVGLAVDEKRQAERDARRQRGSAYDEVWCVCDHDDHPRLREALAKAGAAGIHVAFPNPCIELWFVLHFEDVNTSITGQAVRRRSKELLNCGKRLSTSALGILLDRHDDATKRAMVGRQARRRWR